MFKKILIVITIALFSITAKAEPLEVGVVDFGYIMTYSKATKSINQQIDSKKEEFMARDKQAQAKIIKQQQELSEKKTIISATEFEKARKKLENQIKIEQAKSQRNRIILKNGILEARKFLDKAVRKYVAKIADDKGLNIVLPQEQVIISAAGLSITNEVLELVNSDIKEIKINFASSKH